MLAWTITNLSELIRAKRLSPVELTMACLTAIEHQDEKLRCFVAVDAERALANARAREAEVMRGAWRGPMHGIPVAYKDLFVVDGFSTSCGTRQSEYLRGVPEAEAVRRLVEAGAVTIGKLSMSELAMGAFGDNPHHGDVQNPWCDGHASGGSSSGSAAAVSAGFVLSALGTDTGGSIRLPAACCGVVGLKPTYGSVSRAGVMPLSWSLDHVGPIARTVGDVAAVQQVIARLDRRDHLSTGRTEARHDPSSDATGMRIGIPANYFFDDVDGEMSAAVLAVVATLEAHGAKPCSVQIPDAEMYGRVATAIARPEATAAHAAALRAADSGLGAIARARLREGAKTTAEAYLQAVRLRRRLLRKFVDLIFDRVDVVITPVIPEPAPPYAAATAGDVSDVIARMGRFSRFTRPFNLLGLPTLSLPCGFSRDGRPLACQVVGRPFGEATVLRVGQAYERHTTWHASMPPVHAPAAKHLLGGLGSA